MSLSLDANGELLSLPGGLKNPTTPAANALKGYKQGLIKSGILTYADAYQFANNYIHDVPSICTILQKRFPFVVVDEMQDMNRTQIDLLEDIFFKADSTNCFQRIGDMNQAIYGEDNGDTANEGVWYAREPTLHLMRKTANYPLMAITPLLGGAGERMLTTKPLYRIIGISFHLMMSSGK